MTHLDAVVIGAGVQGASAAYHLASVAGMSVGIVDQFRIGGVASRASAAMVTQQTGHFVTAQLARESLALYMKFIEAGWDIGFHTCGYTTFASDPDSTHYVLSSAEALSVAGVEYLLADGDAARDLVVEASGGFLSVNSDSMSAITVRSDGFVDPDKLVKEFLKRGQPGIQRIEGDIRALQVLFRSHSGVTGVRLATGEEIACSVVVNCAGAWAGEIGAQVGLVLPIRRSRRQMAIIRTDPVWTLNGIVEHLSHSDGEWYFRPMGDDVLVGSGAVRWLDEDAPLVDEPPVADDVNRLVGHYLQRNTRAEVVELVHAWAGDRPITFGPAVRDVGDALETGGTNVEVRDRLPMIGRHPEIGGYVDSCGWGEYGVTLAPIGGWLVSQLVSGNATPIDLAPLSNARFSPLWTSGTHQPST